MTLSAARVSSRTRFFLGAVAAAALTLAPQAALAQHGGGGHGGGGGGHFGGGGHSGGSSGGSHASAPAPASHSSSAPAAFVRPPSAPATQTDAHNSVSNNFSAGSRPLSFSSTHPGPVAFAGGDAAASTSGTAVPHVTIGFPPSGESDTEHSQLLVDGGPLSFSGQGHEIWQNSPGVTPGLAAAPRSALAVSRPAANELPAQPRMFPPRRFLPGPIFAPGYGGFFGPGFGFYPFFGFGFGGCDLFFWNVGCNALGYWGPYSSGYYPSDMYLGAGGYGGTDAGPDTSQGYGAYAPQNPPSDNSGATAATQVVTLYLNDGTSFAVTDYWVADYKLHYVTEDAREGALDLDQIDVQRTVDENASRGVTFTLKPAPAAAPDSSPAPRP